jgi:transcriptional regulator of acetoin/glycerol metabolism
MGGVRDTASGTDASGASVATHDAPRPQLVLVLERARLAAGGARYALGHIDRVTIGRAAVRVARRIVDDGRPTLEILIPDERISIRHARIDREGGAWRFVDCDSTNGARVNRVRVKSNTLSDGDVLEVGRTLFRYRAAMTTPVNAVGDVDTESLQGLPRSFGTLLPWLERDLEMLARVARSEVAVLLLGETGTGKEVLARGIHEHSGRKGPFVAVNCGSLPTTLIESLFFGHQRGAFSGAVRDEIGFVRAAQGGTLFLDEVGDLPESGQAALLRVLQEREVIPVGSTRAIAVDIRVVAATHRPLPMLVRSGAFRQDLFARLAAFTYAVPPLRDRIDDIGVLIAALLGPTARQGTQPLSLSSAAAYTLIEHSWPHNVRELEQRLKIGTLLGSSGRIDLAVSSPEAAVEGAVDRPARRTPVTLHEIEHALREMPNVSAAAKMLQIHRSHLYRLIRQFGIDTRGE